MGATNIFISQTSNSPQIELYQNSGFIKVSGVSISSRGVSALKQLIESIKEYSKHPHDTTRLDIELYYFNTQSALAIYNILITLQSLNKSGNSTVEVNWIVESDDDVLQEAADDFQSICPDLPIKTVKIGVLAA